MNYLLRNLRIPVGEETGLELAISRKLGLPQNSFIIQQILRKALDTRRKAHPIWDYSLELSFPDCQPVSKDLSPYISEAWPELPTRRIASDPSIIGMGPAGLFAALALVERGFKPRIYDQGCSLDTRAKHVSNFWERGVLREESNVQFGEGGAGAFSDGKLTSRGNNPVVRRIYDLLVQFGADPAIKFEALPHCGTDGIRALVSRIRDYLISQGTEFRYEAKLRDLETEHGRLKRIKINDTWEDCSTLILALGNSSRDTFRMLAKRGLALESKDFAVGFRIEHPQSQINRAIYGNEKWAETLGAATYRLADGKVYSFCMCPGGEVIAASSSSGTVVTNGMSFSSRSGEYCNSAIVTSVGKEVFGSSLFAGMEFQELIERESFRQDFYAPAQRIEDFLKAKDTNTKLFASYRPGVESSDLSKIYPAEQTDLIKSSLQKFNAIVDDFSRNAVLIAPETRTSSPIRITRDKAKLCSISCEDVFPVGEGSGYAGGIISSAADAYKTASTFLIR
ncbi:MAG TPA: hypothetical protein PLX59_01780 [Candidatus Cloacimonadota bacterium]|nr:hypothetical protein [Candidatus Cloacimonadota bacterium]